MILRDDAAIELVGEADDGEAGLDLIARVAPDVVLMDIRMPRLDGLEALARLMGQPAPPKVIVLTTFDADDHVRAGAARRSQRVPPQAHPTRRRSSRRCTRSPPATTCSPPA